MLRVWRHLRLLRRGGRAHDPAGAKGTTPGELAVLCPACPYPDINLPPDWRSAAKAYVLYSIIISSIYALSDTFITRALASTRVSVSSDAIYQVMRRILP